MSNPHTLRARSRRAGATATALAVLLGAAWAAVPADAAPTPHTGAPAASAGDDRLTNLDHLDWLGTRVDPPEQEGHTTYRLAQEPRVGVLWVYAEPDGDGGFEHVGGGTYDPTTDTYGQGAYDADDIARAAVVYLRDWRQTGSPASREHAYRLLRGLTYLQTVSGPNAGNVVLWMQPDGTLNPSAEPKDDPDPSDSDASFWLARTIWALGEGYAAFRGTDPGFAAFLKDRLDLAIDALDREVLDEYGHYLRVDGHRAPAWLVGDGADASSEAALGLAAYVEVGGPEPAREALAELAEGIADLSGGTARTWPFGALRPYAPSLSMWHGWGAQMPSALAEASTALGRPGLADPAVRDSFTFDPWLLTSGGPDNGRLPTRVDPTQIAYGADARLQGLLATADAGTSGQRRAALRMAGVVGAWYFGANPAGQPMYDPATGVTYDGINADGSINRNSGAESTIHGLLSMLALDAHPRVARWAGTADVVRRAGTRTVQAEDGRLSGPARAVAPDSLWTGEAQYGGTGYAALGDGGSVSIRVPAARRSLLIPVVDLRPGSDATVRFRANGRRVGVVDAGDVGPQGDSPVPGALLPVTLPRAVHGRRVTLTATAHSTGGDRARLDAVMLEPLVSRLVLRGDGHGTALLSSRAARGRDVPVRVPGSGPARVETYDGQGHLREVSVTAARAVSVDVPAGGFAIVRR